MMRMINADYEEMQKLSMIRKGDTITVVKQNGRGIKHLLVQGTSEHGVRLCPWDERFLFIPIICRQSGEIVGDGKKKMLRRS